MDLPKRYFGFFLLHVPEVIRIYAALFGDEPLIVFL
jgi:hypothetical protein